MTTNIRKAITDIIIIIVVVVVVVVTHTREGGLKWGGGVNDAVQALGRTSKIR